MDHIVHYNAFLMHLSVGEHIAPHALYSHGPDHASVRHSVHNSCTPTSFKMKPTVREPRARVGKRQLNAHEEHYRTVPPPEGPIYVFTLALMPHLSHCQCDTKQDGDPAQNQNLQVDSNGYRCYTRVVSSPHRTSESTAVPKSTALRS